MMAISICHTQDNTCRPHTIVYSLEENLAFQWRASFSQSEQTIGHTDRVTNSCYTHTLQEMLLPSVQECGIQNQIQIQYCFIHTPYVQGIIHRVIFWPLKYHFTFHHSSMESEVFLLLKRLYGSKCCRRYQELSMLNTWMYMTLTGCRHQCGNVIQSVH